MAGIDTVAIYKRILAGYGRKEARWAVMMCKKKEKEGYREVAITLYPDGNWGLTFSVKMSPCQFSRLTAEYKRGGDIQ